jgi:hypothetical protein
MAANTSAIPGFVDIEIIYKLYEPENKSDTRRALTSYRSRFQETPQEQVFQRSNGTYILVGTQAQTSSIERHKVIFELLPDVSSGAKSMKPEELLNKWFTNNGVSKPSRRTLEGDLAALIGKGVIRYGEGKKNSPYTYVKDNSIHAGSYSKETEKTPEII